jgi:hypothetical protein
VVGSGILEVAFSSLKIFEYLHLSESVIGVAIFNVKEVAVVPRFYAVAALST